MWRKVLVLIIRKCRPPADSPFKSKTSTIATLYTRPLDDGLQICRNMWRRGKVIKIKNSASRWFLY
jgi:hypothetical protein